jgi:hypothetical protein
MNPVLTKLYADRAEVLDSMDAVLGQIEGRDMVDAERSLLEAAKERLELIDRQIEPLQGFESLRGAHNDALAALDVRQTPSRPPAQPRRADGGDRTPSYSSPGAFLVDYLRALGLNQSGGPPTPDAAALARVMQARVVADQKTGDVPGILPTPIVGQVVSLIDANRPLIASLGGAKALENIPGATFSRPKVTQHTLVGPQAGGEKTQLPSQKMTIAQIPFSKATYGGTVDISRQSIDWTSPAAWDILIRDLADEYAIQTETATAATPVVVASNDLKGWTLALYTAAMHAYSAGRRMPDRVWCSLDVWAALGSLVDVARPAFPQNTVDENNAPGTSSLASFNGDVLGLPRIVVPTFAAGTAIVGSSSLFEVYEEVIGLLSVIEPSILGVQVAYGGYVASGALDTASLVPLTAPAGMPTMLESDGNGGDSAPEADDADEPPTPANGGGSSSKSSSK